MSLFLCFLETDRLSVNILNFSLFNFQYLSFASLVYFLGCLGVMVGAGAQLSPGSALSGHRKHRGASWGSGAQTRVGLVHAQCLPAVLSLRPARLRVFLKTCTCQFYPAELLACDITSASFPQIPLRVVESVCKLLDLFILKDF